ncbi:MAG: winged helix-turn-helix transcriptional regulator [Thermoleophilia bacterium]
MLPRDYSTQNCSLARALEVLGERWTMLVLRDAFQGVTRFELFQRRLKIAPNILTKRLATLVEAGVLERRRYQERPERFEYVLTPAGKELLPALVDLMRWGDAHLAPDGAPAVLRHAGCGGELGRGAVCDRCGTPVEADDVEWYRGPGTHRTPGERMVPA